MLPISITFTFASQSSTIPLQDLDTNFTLLVNTLNGIGNGNVSLANVQITGGSIANAVAFSAGNVTLGNTLVALGTTASNLGNLILANATLTTLYTGGGGVGNAVSNSLAANVVLNNTAAYFDGPSVNVGTTGTWFVSGSVTLIDNTTTLFSCKLWDGNTVIDSAQNFNTTAARPVAIALSGPISSPAGNLRISVLDNNPTGNITANITGAGKDSTITAIRIA